ncbi:MAG: orotidine-5'-phosphate decarboxylase [Phycisphaera sp.]|nr:orotidine-5'-phosphate decarboxylase [Phycisphaera sp.]
MAHFVDTLLDRIEDKGAPVCVGIDPVLERMPKSLLDDVRGDGGEALDAVADFVLVVLDAVADHVPAVKFQSACFERYGAEGVAIYEQLIGEARRAGLVVIGDVKRGDIGSTAAHYAHATMIDPPCEDDVDDDERSAAADAVTVNSYFGLDGLSPFCDLAAAEGKGVFALVRTSNPGGDAIQSLPLADGRTVAEAVGALVAEIGSDSRYVGQSGYSLLGAVVGATKPGDATRLRAIMPRQLFLVPGFGAQGGSADDVRACFNADGAGALITASRSITYAYEAAGTGDSHDWPAAIEAAAIDMKRQVAAIVGG